MDGGYDHPLRPIVSGWLEKLKLARDHKRDKFQLDADEALRFYNGPYNFLYGLKYRGDSAGFAYQGDEDLPKPSFCMTVNKVAECVQIFGPVLYHRNPVRQVNPRTPPEVPLELLGDPNDPQAQMMGQAMLGQTQQMAALDRGRASVLEKYLNYTPEALNLKTESRRMIDEALIKGMGVLWTETYTPVGAGFKMVGSFYDTVDNLLVDPDRESIQDATWVARRRCEPVWQVEDKFGLPRGELKGNLESLAQQAYVQAAGVEGDYRRKQGLTNDLLCYYEVYSKMGMGGRLSGVTPGVREELDQFGDYCYLAVCEDKPYPLNLPPAVIESGGDDDIRARVQWPTPFWADDAWPFTHLAFHEVPREVWPISHIKPGLGELKFINWAYSFLAGKVKNTCRDFVAILKSAGEELKNTVLKGEDLELIEIERSHGSISEVVQFLQHPQMNGDIFRVIETVEHNFEMRVGLTELMYGYSSNQLRSASEAQVKADQLRIRPDDMANKVEDVMSEVARKEAMAARWHLTPQDVAPVLGPVGAYWWQQLVVPSNPSDLLHQLEYRIEAGSARKPNRERKIADMNTAMQTLGPILQGWAMSTGDIMPLNSLVAEWAKSLDIDPSRYMLSPPAPPPPMPAPAPEGPPTGGPPA